MSAHPQASVEGLRMSRLPIKLPPAANQPMRGRLREAVFFCLAFIAVFIAALLAMEMLLG